ncbi:hypothetical protein KEN51_CDS0361 [Pseudomonas phage vB_Pae10145-KEN51]|uniref:Uncharacterized protein n=1 Tax=Pseudomonas phage PA7 TaxID=347330 RepID=I7CDS1_9CAUD|nr:hypothetical protein FDI90_gp322 [Pseudomonas phage PA7]UXD83060.1 hypothetical protein NP274_00008 [Pseudomonas phage Koomba boorn-mokiny kep-wari Wadjak 1]UXD83613.1 hypothetical protein NP274_00206 [Pseudomonas phage Koomba boorn-mokiny kep-wari Wadjak 2]WAX23607.1 hypothetical protein [Pseudomonas phage pPA-N1803-4At.2]WNV49656.1 hypothetical protein [Pseudomonas phage ANB1]WPJ69201.1 hypothetical protein PAZH1_78 [Pseudomonas phage PA_ZH1]BBI55851.1 phage protein [Pseudomonas phage PA
MLLIKNNNSSRPLHPILKLTTAVVDSIRFNFEEYSYLKEAFKNGALRIYVTGYDYAYPSEDGHLVIKDDHPNVSSRPPFVHVGRDPNGLVDDTQLYVATTHFSGTSSEITTKPISVHACVTEHDIVLTSTLKKKEGAVIVYHIELIASKYLYAS